MNTITIEIDGQDKVGKDVLHRYIEQLSNYRYIINTRGILTQLVYSDKFKRGYEFELNYQPFVVLLTADDQDLEIRGRIHSEPKTNTKKDRQAFDFYADELIKKGVKVMRFNTSEETMLQIAKKVIDEVEKYIQTPRLLSKPICLKTHDVYTSDDLVDEDVFYGGLVSNA